MGGRGTSSASARKASGGGLSSVEGRMGELSATMRENARYTSMPPGAERSSMEMAYRRAQGEYQRLQGVRSELIRKGAAKPPSAPAPRKKTNGHGEATSRDITSLSYERARRRLNEDVDRWFGRGMGR